MISKSRIILFSVLDSLEIFANGWDVDVDESKPLKL